MISNLVGNKSKLPGEIRILLALVFSIISNPIFPQHFSDLYYDNQPSMLFGSILADSNYYYVTGVTSTTFSPYYEKALFGKINLDGVLDSIYVFVDSDINSYNIFNNSLKITVDGNFLATGEMFDSLDRAFVVKWDTAGKILFWHTYSNAHSQNDLFQGMDIVELAGQGYLIAINSEIINNSNVVSNTVIIRTDTAGNILNEQTYGAGEYVEFPSVLRTMKNGNYMIGAFNAKQGYPSTPYYAHTWLIEVDSMGNEVTNWLDPDPTTMYPNGMQQTADGGWIIVRQHLALDEGNEQAFNASILKIDENFNKQWELDTGGIDFTAGMNAVQILPDGNYICVGETAINITNDSSHDYGWIMKISTTGQVLWQQNYLANTGSGIECTLYDIDILSNGDLLACGEMDGGAPVQQAWILRTDSTGCEVNCSTAGIEELPASISNLTIYPNPATNQLIISATGFLPAGEAWQPQTIAIYNLNGQPACAAGRQLINLAFAQEVDISTLPAGVYFVEVTGTQATEVRKLVKL